MAKVMRVVNMVAVANFHGRMDISGLSNRLGQNIAQPNHIRVMVRYPDLYKRGYISTATVFHTGKAVLAGANSYKSLAYNWVRLLSDMWRAGLGFERVPLLEVVNVVYEANLGYPVNLDTIALTMNNVDYDPEQFPGLILKFFKERYSVTIFSNGRVIIAGPLEYEEAVRTLERVEEILSLVDASPIQ
ncbi:hypothetical protein [Pyrococcus kukulkanii]|uniref:TATA-box-binding protein n=1 Tax=Pyrococcus kukulkanii TaxID=1609559 RepID=A0ABV4T6A5_9EURY